jgi:hypothetical protein
MRKATSHAPRIVAGAGSAFAPPAEETEKTATSVANKSRSLIFIPGTSSADALADFSNLPTGAFDPIHNRVH